MQTHVSSLKLTMVAVCSACAVTILLAVMVLPTLASPPRQNGNDFPTPTLSVAAAEPVSIELVGGTVETIVYDGETIGAFEISETSATSNYPNGILFNVAIASELDIARVTLFIRYPHGSGERTFAELVDADTGEWQALLYDTPGQPPWQVFDFYWSVTADTGDFAETTPQSFIYSDPTRVWMKSETPLLRLYWFGYDESFGQLAQDTIAGMQERYIQGFGQPLSYVPIAVLYPDVDSFLEFQSRVESSRQPGGFTSSALGMTVQRVRNPDESDCPLYPETPDEQSMAAASTISHEVAHLYQYENNVIGPTWFIEGGATWFSANPFRGRQEGLRDRDVDADLPTLQGVGPSRSGIAPNGCDFLAYWMGFSFHNYLYGVYGIDAISTWYELVSRNVLMDDALIAATGKNLAELERDWRVYLGLTPDVFVRPTDAYSFPSAPTPFGQ